MMIAGEEPCGKDADLRFAETPWDEQTPQWRELEESLPADHLIRQIDLVVGALNLTELYATYLGRGSKALRPDLLLKLVLYEKQGGRPSPAQWLKDSQENEPVQWLLFGMRPSRTALYEFWDRIEELWDEWNEQVLRKARESGMPVGERVAVDGTVIAALASRHRLVNQKTLTARQEALEQAVSADGSSVIGIPTDVGGMALCYRTDLFKAAGLPTDPAAVSALWPTWDDFIKTGQAYVLRDLDGKAISVAAAKQLVRDRFTVSEEIRRSRRRHSRPAQDVRRIGGRQSGEQ